MLGHAPTRASVFDSNPNPMISGAPLSANVGKSNLNDVTTGSNAGFGNAEIAVFTENGAG
jgi:hypothetical protein